MNTRRIEVDPVKPDPKIIAKAATIILDHGLVAFPTETVYGLGANGMSETAVRGIFRAKGRPAVNPVILHIASVQQMTELVKGIPEQARCLMREFWPGPLTLLFNRSDKVHDVVTAGGDKVGIRMPAHEVARALIDQTGVAIAAPSANVSGRVSPTKAEHVLADLQGRIDMVLDGGPTGVGLESTVLDVTVWPPKLLRPGGIATEQLRRVLGVEPVSASGGRPKLSRYKGDNKLILVDSGDDEAVACYVAKEVSPDKPVAVFVTDETADALSLPADVRVVKMGSGSRPDEIGKRLFAGLRELESVCDVIIVEGLPEQGLGRAIMDRLRSAADDNDQRETNVLFVCTGNTCRSPMAEGLLTDEGKEKGLPINVQSAGIAAGRGTASSKAIDVMNEIGICIKEHQSRTLSQEMIRWADVVLVMTESHRQAVLDQFPESADKLQLLTERAGEKSIDIADPFGGDSSEYRRCRDQLRQLIPRLASSLAKDQS